MTTAHLAISDCYIRTDGNLMLKKGGNHLILNVEYTILKFMQWSVVVVYYNHFFSTTPPSNVGKVLKLIILVVEQEAITELTFDYLKVVAPTQNEKKFIQKMLDDERGHYKELKQIYFSITGQQAEGTSPTFEPPVSYLVGLSDLFYKKIEIITIYKKMKRLATNLNISETLADFIDDELGHLSMINHILIKNNMNIERVHDYQVLPIHNSNYYA